jgi:hypothetical protein
MTANDTARALIAMDDPTLRAEVAAVGAEALAAFGLDDDELGLVIAAARSGEDDDTVGFGAFAPPYVPMGANISLLQAVRYVEDGQLNSATRSDFTAFTAKLGAQGDW